MDKWEDEFDKRFPVRPALEYPDKDVFYSVDRFGLTEATIEDFKAFIAETVKAEKVALLEEIESGLIDGACFGTGLATDTQICEILANLKSQLQAEPTQNNNQPHICKGTIATLFQESGEPRHGKTCSVCGKLFPEQSTSDTNKKQ